jgi:hypothetical protein
VCVRRGESIGHCSAIKLRAGPRPACRLLAAIRIRGKGPLGKAGALADPLAIMLQKNPAEAGQAGSHVWEENVATTKAEARQSLVAVREALIQRLREEPRLKLA